MADWRKYAGRYHIDRRNQNVVRKDLIRAETHANNAWYSMAKLREIGWMLMHDKKLGEFHHAMGRRRFLLKCLLAHQLRDFDYEN